MKNVAMRSHRRAGQANSVGFTVVELLVVVAIIAILLAIMLPAFLLTRGSARQTLCFNNLHQISMVAVQYANTNKRVLASFGYEKEFRSWIPRETYINPKGQKKSGFNETYKCPDQKHIARKNNANRQREGNSRLNSGAIMDYGINNYGFSGVAPGRGKTHYPNMVTHRGVKRYLTATNKANAIYFADADWDESPHDIGGVSRGSHPRAPRFWPIIYSFQTFAYKRHLGGYNAVGLDASSQWYPGSGASLVKMVEPWYIPKAR